MSKNRAVGAKRGDLDRDASRAEQKMLDAEAKRLLRLRQLQMILREEALRKADKK